MGTPRTSGAAALHGDNHQLSAAVLAPLNRQPAASLTGPNRPRYVHLLVPGVSRDYAFHRPERGCMGSETKGWLGVTACWKPDYLLFLLSSVRPPWERHP